MTIGSQANQNWLRLGINAGAVATYNLSGSSSVLLDYGHLNVGENGSGTLTQSSGSIAVPNDNVYIAGGSTGLGLYNFSGGTLSTGDVRVGQGGNGTFTQTGGLANLRSWLRLGEAQTGVGLYNVSAGTINVGQMARIGEEGSGTLNLSGNAMMTVGQSLTAGLPIDNTALPGSGVVNISGSSILNVQQRFVDGFGGGSGLVNISGNAALNTSLVAASDNVFSVGDSNGGAGTLPTSGTLNITGGTVSTSSAEMWIGNQVNSTSPQGNGTLNLSAGVMTVGNWFVVGRNGAVGLVNMTGGSLTQQTNGNFDVAVGSGAQGTFNQSGGTVNVGGQLLVPENGDTTTLGTYNLSGSGVLITNSWLAVGRGGGTGNFNFSGGTLQHSNNHITVGSGGTGVFSMTGGLLVDSATSAFVGENSDGTLEHRRRCRSVQADSDGCERRPQRHRLTSPAACWRQHRSLSTTFPARRRCTSAAEPCKPPAVRRPTLSPA